MKTPKFNVKFLEEASVFIDGLDQKVKEKIIYNITKARFSNDRELFKKLNEEIWEFRTLFNKTHYRLFAFWDKTDKAATIVIATHGLIKKTDKTPPGELNKTEQLRKKYFELKNNK